MTMVLFYVAENSFLGIVVVIIVIVVALNLTYFLIKSFTFFLALSRTHFAFGDDSLFYDAFAGNKTEQLT